MLLLEWALMSVVFAHSVWDCVAILCFLWVPSAHMVRDMYPSIFLHQQVILFSYSLSPMVCFCLSIILGNPLSG